MTSHANHHLRLFLLYDRRTSAEAKTTRAAQSSEPLPSPPAIQDHQRVREDTLVLLLHFTTAVKPPPAVSGELPRLPCCVLRLGASGSNSTK